MFLNYFLRYEIFKKKIKGFMKVLSSQTHNIVPFLLIIRVVLLILNFYDIL